MDRIPDVDFCDEDENPRRYPRRSNDEPDTPTREEIMREAQEFHDEWSRQNPNRVYGQPWF